MKKVLRIIGYIFGVYAILDIAAMIALNASEKVNHWFFDDGVNYLPDWFIKVFFAYRKE